MEERPILFNSEMIKAILDGRKTMTRRVVKIQPESIGAVKFTEYPTGTFNFTSNSGKVGIFNPQSIKCPYGIPGDQLWVRETWAKIEFGYTPEIIYKADTPNLSMVSDFKGWKPSIHMFRRHSRIQLEITDIRVERVQDIDEIDAQAEGTFVDTLHELKNSMTPNKDQFSILWDSINKKRGFGWGVNPFVWVVEFERI